MSVDEGRQCARCACRLSRYNEGQLCSACMRLAQDDAPPALRVPDHVWRDPGVQGALAAWDFGLASRLIRERTSFRQEDIATLTGLSQAYLSMLESGARKLTNISKAVEFLGGLGVPGHLVALPLPGRPAHRRPEAPSTPTAELQIEWEDPLAIVRRAQSMASVNVDDATLITLRGSLDDLVERYEAVGPQALAPRAVEIRGLLHSLLSGSQHPRQRRELYALAAMTSGLLGYMAVNAGRLPTSRSYSAEALQLATEVEDSSLVAWVRGTQSLEAYYDGRYAEAHDFAMAGVEHAPDSPQTIRLLANGAARALSKQGERAAAERTAQQALELADRFVTPEGLTPCISFAPYGRARTFANVATAYVSLGDVTKVLHYAEQVDAHIDSADSAWSRALVALDVASAVLQQQQPDVEQAMALGQTALRASSSRPIRSVVQRAHELEQQANKWRKLPEVREYAEALRSWRATPASYVVCASDPAPRL
ncbi:MULTISPECIES: helix-turn-helix domain-containing protein [unclassified Streptomyces]|uniref:helix-turn-helix domain-containing protein n=1 Tax=unclassified Streptomyces TaxID=2593676 RepID=UPI00194369D3|nr:MULTISPECIES: helix-turn-helix domain-containing protein [unclassified Streptomyces]